MGAKGSKGAKGAPKSPTGAATVNGTPTKIKLPPKKVKKESPYDLTAFVQLGGKVEEEYVEIQREASLGSIVKKSDDLTPPKPISEMTGEEKKAWEQEVEKHEKKLAMQKLMEKNLQQKIKHGDKPIEPPVAGGLLGKAKKKIQQTQEKLAAKAEEVSRPTESVEERIKRQAMAGAQGTLTGGATAALGQDIAKSQAMRDLEKKRKEFEKQEQLRKKQEEEARKKQEEEKKKNKPKGLADFLNQVETPGSESGNDNNASTPSEAIRESTGHKLKVFLSQVEEPPVVGSSEAISPTAAAAPRTEPAANDQPKSNMLASFLSSSSSTPSQLVVEENKPPEPSPENRPKSNKLNAFLLSTSSTAGNESSPSPAAAAERPKSERKSFIGAAIRRLSIKSSEATTTSAPVAEEASAAQPENTEPEVEQPASDAEEQASASKDAEPEKPVTTESVPPPESAPAVEQEPEQPAEEPPAAKEAEAPSEPAEAAAEVKEDAKPVESSPEATTAAE